MFRELVNQHSNIQTSQDDVCWAGWATNTAKIADFHLKYSIEGKNLENKTSGETVEKVQTASSGNFSIVKNQ